MQRLFERVTTTVKAEERSLVTALVIAWIATMTPIWWPRFLPLLDQPNHLGLIAVWHRLGDPSWGYREFYTSSAIPVPYWGYYFPVHLLTYVFPIEIANKLYLSAYATAVPASVLALARRFDRSPWLALLVFPSVFNVGFGYGFISYCAGVPTALFTLVVLDRFLDRPSAAGLVALIALTLLTFFMHVLAWAFLGVCALFVLLAHPPRWRRALVAAGGLLATVVFAWLDFRFVIQQKVVMSDAPTALKDRYEPAMDSLIFVYRRLVMMWPREWPGGWDEVTLLLLAASWLLLASTGRRDSSSDGDGPTPVRRQPSPALRSWIPEICCAVAWAGYFLLPFRIYRPLDWWNINPRLLLPATLLGALIIRGSITGLRRLLLVPALVAAVGYPLALAQRFQDFNRRSEGFVTLMRHVPRGSSTLVLTVGNKDDASVDPEFVPYTEFGSYAQILSGGFNPIQFETGFPFRSIPDRRLPAPPWNRPQLFDQAGMGSRYDFVLTHREPADKAIFRTLAPRVRMVAKVDPWRLYATRGVR